MASRANSTGAPDAHLKDNWWGNPANPLPDDASPAWNALWLSVSRTHQNAPLAIAAAFAAGVDPETFCALTLHSPDPAMEATMPHVWFGPDYRSPACRIFTASGERGQ